MNQNGLLDPNLYKIIERCYINGRRPDMAEIHVIYADDSRENIWTFNPLRYEFENKTFIGMTKIEAVFYCDRKEPRGIQLY